MIGPESSLSARLLSALILVLVAHASWACTCMEIASIENSVATMPILVEAQVVSLDQADTVYGRQTYSATLKIKKVLKGRVSSDAITVEHWMCYASLHLDLMKVHHTYVLPLHEPNDDRYHLATCAHSGMELIAGKLYTFELTDDGGRKLQFHARYTEFVRGLANGSK